MFRKALILTACVLGFCTCRLQADVVNSKWVGGSHGEWADGGNWDPHMVPDNKTYRSFNVTIDSDSVGVAETEVYLREDRTVDRLDCYGKVGLGGQQPWVWRQLTLVDHNGLTNYGVLKIHAWGVELFGINGKLTNTSGAMVDFHGGQICGDVNNQTGAELQVNGEVDVRDGDVENDGLISIGDHELNIKGSLHNRGQIKVYTGGCCADVLQNDANAAIVGLGLLCGGKLLTNKGTIRSDGGSLLVATAGELSNSGFIGNAPATALNVRHLGTPEDVNNQGMIQVNPGGGIAFDCNLVNEPNGVIQLLGGTLSAPMIVQPADANFVGFGEIASDIIIDPNGIIKLTGLTNIVGDVQIAENATLQISDGTTLITGHTACNGMIHMKGGRIIPQGGLSGDCNIIWEAGLYSNVADFNLDGQINLKDFAEFADVWLWHAYGR